MLRSVSDLAARGSADVRLVRYLHTTCTGHLRLHAARAREHSLALLSRAHARLSLAGREDEQRSRRHRHTPHAHDGLTPQPPGTMVRVVSYRLCRVRADADAHAQDNAVGANEEAVVLCTLCPWLPPALTPTPDRPDGHAAETAVGLPRHRVGSLPPSDADAAPSANSRHPTSGHDIAPLLAGAVARLAAKARTHPPPSSSQAYATRLPDARDACNEASEPVRRAAEREKHGRELLRRRAGASAGDYCRLAAGQCDG